MHHHRSTRPARWLTLAAAALVVLAAGLHAQDAGKRQPVPDTAALKKGEALVLDIFGDDIKKAKDAAERAKLAGLLLQQGKETREDAAARYVLYTHARKLAADAGEATLALQVVDELTRDFDLPALDEKAAVLSGVVANVAEADPAKALVEVALGLLGEAVDQDNYPAARALGDVANKAAKKSKSVALVTNVQKRVADVEEVEKNFAKLQPFIDRLKKNAKDAEANLELGRYFALLKGKWERGLPLLAQGSDAPIRDQAKKDLAKPKDGAEQLAVADGWWELAAKQKDPVAANMMMRAGHWYEQVVVNLTGISRTKAQKRLDQIAALGKPITVEGPPVKVGLLKTFEGHTNDVKSVAFSPDGKHALSGSVDTSMRLWDANTGKEVRSFRGHTKEVWNVAFTPANQPISASWDGNVKLWSLDGKELKTYVHPKDVNGIAVSRDGKWLLTGCDDYKMRLWDLQLAREERSFSGHSNYCYGVAFSPDMKHVASGGNDRVLKIHEFASGQKVREITEQNGPVNCVAFSSDGRFVFSCGDNAAHMWEVATGKEAKRFQAASSDIVHAMALSPDGKRLLTGHDDNSVRLWDVATGKELHRFTGHTSRVMAVAFAADGRRALSGSGGSDTTVRMWGLPR